MNAPSKWYLEDRKFTSGLAFQCMELVGGKTLQPGLIFEYIVLLIFQ